jgi:rhodanese-related sulfurtransferase
MKGLYFMLSLSAVALLWITGLPNDACAEAHQLSPSEFETLAAVGDAYLSQVDMPKTISAQELWAEMHDTDTTQPYILSIRHWADDSLRGHLHGAVHWEYTSITNPALRPLLPTDKKIVVYCYAGQTSAFVSSYLNLMGYDAYHLKWGMSGWVSDTSVIGAMGAWYALKRSPADLETTPHELTTVHPFPAVVCSTASAKEMITERFNAYFQAGYKTKITMWDWVRPVMQDTIPANDYFIVSYMPRSQYNQGHFPGSYCIEPGRLGYAEDLKYLPPDKPILVACADGHTSGQVSMYLRMLGYDAWTLRFGANALTDNPAVLGADNVWTPSNNPNYPVEKGSIERH